MTTNDNDLVVRRIRIAPGVRDAVRRYAESRPESPRAREAREDRAEMARAESAGGYSTYPVPVENCPVRHARLTPTRPCGVCGYVTDAGAS